MKQKILKILRIIAIIYFTMTPAGAVRLSIFMHGYPFHAIIFDLKDEPYKVGHGDNQIVYSFENPPFEEVTQSQLYNWTATKYGPFYIGRYHGWG